MRKKRFSSTEWGHPLLGSGGGLQRMPQRVFLQTFRVMFLLVLLAIVGCAGAPKVQVSAVEAQQQFEGKTVAEVLEATEAEMANAQQQELAFYSPGFFGVAKKALEEAQFLVLAPKEAAMDEQSANAEIFTTLLLANKSLAQAGDTKLEVQKRLQDILTVRTSLVAKGIDKSAAGEFEDLMDGLLGLFQRIEKRELEGFEQSQKVTLRQFRRLESQSVKAVQLDDIIVVLEKAEAMGAAGAAPKSYKKTRQALKNAQAVIERDPNDQSMIKDAVGQFSFETNHLVHAAQEVKELRVLNHAAMENILLAAESRLLAISDALRQPDPRQHSLREQTEILVNAADKLVAAKTKGSSKPRIRYISKNELDAARARIEQLQAQLRDMQAQNTQLKRGEKPLVKRIDALERVVIKLNNEKAVLETELAKMTAPPANGVEITPIK